MHETVYKKCAQGQVYRAAENDCRGTGNANDWYGAQKLQFCDKDDGSCTTDSWLNASGNSEAYTSCAGDGTQGGGWHVAREILLRNARDKTALTELPRGPYWVNKGYYGGLAVFESLESADSGQAPRTEQRYVLCERPVIR